MLPKRNQIHQQILMKDKLLFIYAESLFTVLSPCTVEANALAVCFFFKCHHLQDLFFSLFSDAISFNLYTLTCRLGLFGF